MINKILFVFGTRPEAIKMAPLVLYFNQNKGFDIKVCNTGQHKELTNEVLNFFKIKADYSLNVMTHAQTLAEVQSKILIGVDQVLTTEKPDLVFVQGDTITAFVAALAAFYKKVKIAHIEAGLRSWDKFSPFPEEINRVFISKIADFHFAPTADALDNLNKEGISSNAWNVGNTVIDALHVGIDLVENENSSIKEYFSFLDKSKKTVLLTSHRRENFGKPILDICEVVKSTLAKYPNLQFVYPVHPNPNVKDIVYRELGDNKNVFLIEPLSYPYLIYLIKISHLVLSDSGGIQEEAPSFGKPVIVLRDTTERMEGVKAGTALLAGNEYDKIWQAFTAIMDNDLVYQQMSKAVNPYGDGKTAQRVFEILKKY